ncbi:hypothetical protein OZX67_03935 [Bifidobacterium sp. ESL0728]|uniref:hypothetical protein n=1 Tax=Bifidobacterium sp. ESL0728 TaxID=2983220 RepID=UPI0023F86121|nr:hypothetical protein [Bifidobacterium sp. ESL0728]WEV59698.1 hypothetical protein OZX67_03935 [Bifidobacterium sp. ESL0728]
MSKSSEEGKPERLLWIDIETTGLDPEHDTVLEAELRVTSMDAKRVMDSRHVVFGVGDDTIMPMTEEVVAMHTANGLLHDAFGRASDFHHQVTVLCVFAEIQLGRWTLHPAGSNPKFDLAFLERFMPEQIKSFHHRMLDLDSLRMAFEAAGLDLPDQTPTDHRTHTCLDRDIKQYRTMLQMLGNLQTSGKQPKEKTNRKRIDHAIANIRKEGLC